MATYSLSSSSLVVDEGSNVKIYISTAGIPNGSLVNYTISSITGSVDSSDFVTPINGYFRIFDNVGSDTVIVRADSKTEFGEIFRISVDDNPTEFLDIYINDTSKSASNVYASFYISSSSLSVKEGETARFDIRALNLADGTAVAYRILGINNYDISVGSNTGVIYFQPTGLPLTTAANVQLTLSEDLITEGPESIILVLEPDFRYSIEVSSTISVEDSSKTITPKYFVNPEKNRVIEGESLYVYLFTENVPEGTIVPYRIEPVKGDITVGDFERIDSLTGTFPPLNSLGQSYIQLFVRDDYLFEQTERFLVSVVGPGGFSGASYEIEIIDSGNTFLKSDAVYTGNATIKFLDSAELEANLSPMAIKASSWKGTTGLLSEDQVLQGKTLYADELSQVFYQPFSYVLRTTKNINEWRNTIKNVLHPAGFAFFSEINNETQLDSVLSLEVKSVIDDSYIDTAFVITSDGDYNDASSNITIDSISSYLNLNSRI